MIAGQDQLLAGASAPIAVGVANVMRFAGVDLATAVAMATHHPAALLGLEPADLHPGDAANLVLFDLGRPLAEAGPIAVKATVTGGEIRCFDAI